MKYPELTLFDNIASVYELSKTGLLLNAYTPLLNLMTNEELGDFTTPELKFDRYTPVDILVTDEYDGSQNLIINDDVNDPKLVNSRVSILENHTYLIPEHSGNKITNVYEENKLSADTSLLKLYNKIPQLTYNGLIDGGSFKCGTYVFYFKLADADGNLSNIVQESGLVLIHIGPIGTSKVRMGLLDESAQKSVSFTLDGLDSGFDYVRVFYERTSTDNSGAPVSLCYMVDLNYPILNDRAEIVLSGSEETMTVSLSDLLGLLADISAAKTLTILHNMLFLGNTLAYAQDYSFLLQLAWKIIPELVLSDSLVGGISGNYNMLSSLGSHPGCYYNTKNVYNYTGYWPDEYYRFGVVFIFDNNLLSRVFNIQGCDFNLVPKPEDGESAYTEVFIPVNRRNPSDPGTPDPYMGEPEDYIFNKKYMTNSKGVIRFGKLEIISGVEDTLVPKVLGILFDISKIVLGLKDKNGNNYTSAELVLKDNHIKGLFFVRLKRIPSILALGLVIGLTGKDYGSIPVIQNKDGVWSTMSFLAKDRLLLSEGSEVEITSEVKPRALLVPDFELNTATYNQLFTGQEYALSKVGNVEFSRSKNDAFPKKYNSASSTTPATIAKVTAVPTGTTVKTDGSTYFSTVAGDAHEAHKTEDVNNRWDKTPPLNLTTSTSLIRGLWGAYVGLTYDDSFSYGDIVTIKPVESVTNPSFNELEFLKRFNDAKLYSPISPRYNYDEMTKFVCYRGDCFPSMYTHRMMGNFIDPELPTNTKIVDPGCWAKNYAVRCTAEILATTHSNLTDDSAGWFIPSPVSKKSNIVSLVFGILSGNIGTVINAIKGMASDTKPPVLDTFTNEIATAFEVYTGADKKTNEYTYKTELYTNSKNGLVDSLEDSVANGYIKKVNPLEQELNSSGLNLKALFKSDDNWELHGLAQINRADVNAVSFGEWITFPMCMSCNAAFRDIDYNNTTEESKFQKKRSFFPLEGKDTKNRLLESLVINGACRVSGSNNGIRAYESTPFIKQEFFNRIYWSKPNISQNVINSYRMIFDGQFKEYNKEFGAITKLESLGDQLIVVFLHGIGILPVNRSVLSEADVVPYLPSRNVLPSLLQTITPDYGSMWKESVLKVPDKNMIFGVDTVARKIWKLSTQGIEFISDHIVTKFLNDFVDLSEYDYKEYVGHINVKTHYNAFKLDVMFTYYKDIPNTIKYELEHDGIRYIYDSTVGDYNKWVFEENIRYTRTYDDYTFANKEVDIYYLEEGTYVRCSGKAITRKTILDWIPGTTWSLCYNLVTNTFTTFYDWYPVYSCNVDNIYFSFNKEELDKVYNRTNDDGVSVLQLETVSHVSGYDNYSLLAKNVIDKLFVEKCRVYATDGFGLLNIKGNFIPFVKDADYYLCFYTQDEPRVTKYSNLIPSWVVKSIQMSSGWWFTYCRFKPTRSIALNKKYFLTFKKVVDSSIIDKVADLKIVIVPIVDGKADIKDLDPGSIDYLYPLRNSCPNRMLLWKHGLAGLYDNLGQIRPTLWYDKLHEFNFEFVVTESTALLKVFNNLKIISNKTLPKKFEYEIVGEGYEWWPYKPVVYWANKHTGSGKRFATLEDAYLEILLNTTTVLRSKYPDFPVTSLETRTPGAYTYKKLPYLAIELTDLKGRKDKSYHPDSEDYWKPLRPGLTTIGLNDYTFNTSETVIKYDPQLNEYRLHDELLGHDMWIYGRTRGNMLYLEDYWNVEIRPLNFDWYYLHKGNAFLSKRSVDQIIFDTTGAILELVKIEDGTRLNFSGTGKNQTIRMILTPAIAGIYPTVDLSMNPTAVIETTALPSGDLDVLIHLNGADPSYHIEFTNVERAVILLQESPRLLVDTFKHSKNTEARHRDKYIKIKVRYSGKDLAIILGIITTFIESKA